MSLVNQVLRDLQDRRTETFVTDGLAAPAADRSRRGPRWLPGAGAAVLVGVLAFVMQRGMTPPDAPIASPRATTPVPVVDAVPRTDESPAVVEATVVTQPDASLPAPTTAIETAVAESPVAEPSVVASPIEPPPSTALTRTLVPATPRSRALEAYSAGADALRAGRRTAAVARLREALSHDATLTDARLLLADVLVGNGAVREAEIVLQQGLQLAIDPAPVAERYARLLYERGDIGGALGVLAASAPPIPDAPEYHALFAAIQQRAGNHAAAAASYRALVDVRPSAGIWWVGLAISLEADGRFDDALSAYAKAGADPTLRPEVARFVNERKEALSR